MHRRWKDSHGATVGQDAPEGLATAPRRILPAKVTAKVNLLNRMSIRSNHPDAVSVCTILAAAVVGGIAYQTGHHSLRVAAVNRLTEIMDSLKRAQRRGDRLAQRVDPTPTAP